MSSDIKHEVLQLTTRLMQVLDTKDCIKESHRFRTIGTIQRFFTQLFEE